MPGEIRALMSNSIFSPGIPHLPISITGAHSLQPMPPNCGGICSPYHYCSSWGSPPPFPCSRCHLLRWVLERGGRAIPFLTGQGRGRGRARCHLGMEIFCPLISQAQQWGMAASICYRSSDWLASPTRRGNARKITDQREFYRKPHWGTWSLEEAGVRKWQEVEVTMELQTFTSLQRE